MSNILNSFEYLRSYGLGIIWKDIEANKIWFNSHFISKCFQSIAICVNAFVFIFVQNSNIT